MLLSLLLSVLSLRDLEEFARGDRCQAVRTQHLVSQALAGEEPEEMVVKRLARCVAEGCHSIRQQGLSHRSDHPEVNVRLLQTLCGESRQMEVLGPLASSDSLEDVGLKLGGGVYRSDGDEPLVWRLTLVLELVDLAILPEDQGRPEITACVNGLLPATGEGSATLFDAGVRRIERTTFRLRRILRPTDREWIRNQSPRSVPDQIALA